MMLEADLLGPRFSHRHSEGQPPNQPTLGVGPLRHLNRVQLETRSASLPRLPGERRSELQPMDLELGAV